MFDWEADAGRRTAHAGGQAQLASSINLYIILRPPKNQPIRKPNLYLEFTPAKRANTKIFSIVAQVSSIIA
ncbi:hypothetical protein OAT86_01920 [Planktomarina sp.]|nr:hypothetical protein [Planktomarina sp.]